MKILSLKDFKNIVSEDFSNILISSTNELLPTLDSEMSVAMCSCALFEKCIQQLQNLDIDFDFHIHKGLFVITINNYNHPKLYKDDSNI